LIIDAEILSRCLKNDQRVIKQLYEHCFRKLMPLCVRYHTNNEDARSSLNIAFVKIIDNLEKLDLEQINFDAWSRRIMSNTLIDEYRKRKKHEEHYLKKETERELDTNAENAKNDGVESLNYEFLLKLIQLLPESTRIVFNLFAIDGYSHTEIVEQLNIPLGTSKWHVSNARKLMKEYIENTENKTLKNEMVG
jgi:RNA polymerase sigma-70 factor (ECF subfamily)